jgi:hypothetical protein
MSATLVGRRHEREILAAAIAARAPGHVVVVAG